MINLFKRINSSNALFHGLISIIILSPIFFGGNNPIVWSLMSLLSGVLLLIWALKNIRKEDINAISLCYIWLIILPFLLVIIWVILQIIITSETLSNPLWQMASEALGQNKTSFPITIDKLKTTVELMKWLGYGAIFWLSFQLGRDRNNAKKMFLAILLTSATIALYGLVMHYFGIEKILWTDKQFYLESVSATFINRNSYATYCGISIIISLAMLFSKIFKNIGHTKISSFYQQLIKNFTSGKTLLYIITTVLLSAALILSNSRAGIISSAIAIISFIILFSLTTSARNYRSLILSLAFLVICIFAFLFNIGGEITSQRFSNLGNEMELRNNIYSITIDAIKDFNLIGSGLGTFENIFAMYQDSRFPYGFSYVIDHAHNSYLETMLEIGIPAFLLLAISLITMIVMCLKGLITRKQDAVFPAIGFSVSILVWIHALFDFSIEMPAIAATYFAIMGVSCANTFSSRQELNNKQVKIWYKITNFTTVIIASTVILLSFYFSFVNIIRAGIDQEVSDMRAKKPFTAIKLQELIARQKSISSFYQSSNSLSNLAISEIFLANYYGYFSPQGRDMLESAKNNLQISLIKSPANSESWFRLAYIESLLESPSQSIANAIYMSIVSMPYDYKIIQSRLVLAEMVEDYFDDEQKEVIKNQITILKSHP